MIRFQTWFDLKNESVVCPQPLSFGEKNYLSYQNRLKCEQLKNEPNLQILVAQISEVQKTHEFNYVCKFALIVLKST